MAQRKWMQLPSGKIVPFFMDEHTDLERLRSKNIIVLDSPPADYKPKPS